MNPPRRSSTSPSKATIFLQCRKRGRGTSRREDNIIEKLQRDGLIAPKGEVDKILNTVVNNLEVGNNLEFVPEIQCRVLMTSTIESFSIGHTIVLSRGLIDVLPDEASLAAMLAKELGYIITNPRNVDTQFAFYDRLQFSPDKAFQHFDFDRKPEQDAAASAKAAEILKKSPTRTNWGRPTCSWPNCATVRARSRT